MSQDTQSHDLSSEESKNNLKLNQDLKPPNQRNETKHESTKP